MILNTGDVPNIYESDEKAEITEQVSVVVVLQLHFFFFERLQFRGVEKHILDLDLDHKVLKIVKVLISVLR